MREQDTVGRLGGDEFVVLVEASADGVYARRARRPSDRDAARAGRAGRRRQAASRSRPASVSRADATRRRTTCCATRTSRCTPRRPPARTATRCSTRASTPTPKVASRCEADLERGGRRRAAVPALPADLRPRPTADGRRRGTRALAPPAARRGGARELHPARGGESADRADRALGARRGVRQAAVWSAEAWTSASP